jgi:hypothetical protein
MKVQLMHAYSKQNTTDVWSKLTVHTNFKILYLHVIMFHKISNVKI